MLKIDKALGLNETILIDDYMSRLTKENQIKALNKLSSSGKQIILTLRDYVDVSKVKANVINTKNFKLNK
tara:strand:- start:767 stop:976 length:210 start_codon:yes stop_codon:yes gene_type:complete